MAMPVPARTDWTIEVLGALPDDGLFVVRLTEGRRPAYPFALGDLLLADEITSPGNPRYDYQTKRTLCKRDFGKRADPFPWCHS